LGMFDEYQRNMTALLSLRLDSEARKEVVGKLVNLDTTRGQNAARRIIHLADYGRGNEPHRGTAYALFQGVTDYVDHERSPTAAADKRFESVTLASGAALKMEALQLLLSRTPVPVAA